MILVKSLMLLLSGSVIFAAGYLSKPAGDDRAADRAAIRAHVESIFQAYIDKDREKVRATHSDDWHGYLMRSQSLSRGIDDYMKMADYSLKNKNAGMTSYKFEEFEIVFHGDLALIFYVAEVEGRTGENKYTDKFRSIDVYEKRDGHWIQTASHLAQHPDAIEKRYSEPTSMDEKIRQSILENREAVWRAWFANDKATLEKLIPEDAIAINSGDPNWSDRAAIFSSAQQFAESGAKLVRLEFPKTEMQVYGNTVILYTTYLFETESNGTRQTSSGRGTEVFVNRNGALVNTGWHLDSED